jgi:prepilin-type N-terminal cleavage/methylation domain-containing protein
LRTDGVTLRSPAASPIQKPGIVTARFSQHQTRKNELPMVNRLHARARRGWTVVELSIVIAVIVILAAIALPNIDFARYRMDANTRTVQNQFITQQLTAIQKNMPVIVTIVYDSGHLTITEDANSNGVADPTEYTYNRQLVEGAQFVIPPVAIDSATPYYATGPGLTYLNQTYMYPTVTFYPNGSTSGDVVIYVGSSSGRLTDMRALQITGATAKVKFYRMQSDGTWKLADM